MINPVQEKRARLRTLVLGGLGLLWAFGLLARAYYLQIEQGPKLAQLAVRQHTAKVTLRARRGNILDRNGVELAISLPVESVFAQPALVGDKTAAAKALGKILGGDYRALRRRLLESGRSFVWVGRQVEAEKIAKIRALDLSGIGFIEESRRYYPGGELAGHVLGFAGIDSVGLEGAEHSFDGYLRGNAEEIIGDRDARGRAILAEGLAPLDRLRGDNVTLTLDARLQHIAERELAAGREAAGAKAGSAIVMDPATGEILALAAEPRYDPNRFEKFTSAEFRDRAVTDLFEPGSTMKMFLMAAGMDAGAISPDDIFFCENGGYQVYDRTFHDTSPHGWLTASSILRVSSNIGAIKVAERVGGKTYYDYLSRFGFGRRTGVGLLGEAEGILPPPRKWSGVTLPSLAFGQGLGVTPLQLLTAASSLANGGVLLKPRILKEVRDADGRVLKTTVPEVMGRTVKEKTARQVLAMLRGVVSEEGTGRNAEVPGYTVAGKTGTAQKVDRRSGGYSDEARVVSFLGLAPASNPRLVVLVLLDEPEEKVTGGAVAAPIFARILTQALAYLEVPPDAPLAALDVPPVSTQDAGTMQKALYWTRPEGPPLRLAGARAGSPGGAGSPAEVIPTLVGLPLREVLRWSSHAGVDIDWQGHGLVAEQKPGPGEALGAGLKVQVVLRPPG